MRRIQADITQRADGQWDVEIGRWQVDLALGQFDRDEVITGRSGLDDAACLDYLHGLVFTGTLRRDSYAQIFDARGGSTGPTPRVGDLLNRTRPLSANQN